MKNKLPKYDNYKPSNVEWLGDIPQHWEVKKLKDICQINRKSLPENTNKNFSFEYVDIGSVNFEKGIINTETFIFKNAPSRARRIAEIGDTIISTVRTYLKAIDYIGDSKDKYIYSTGFAILTPKETHSKYLSMAVKSNSFTNQVDIFSTGMSYPAINSTELGRLKIAIPPLSEQEKIAQFLDEKTTKIDKAIEIKERQIGLLKERRQILIHRAVTKGLNLDSSDLGILGLNEKALNQNSEIQKSDESNKSKFRHSGVEWIGEIPEHWEVKKLKYILHERNERSITGEEPLFMMSQIHGLVVRSDFHEKAEVAQSSVGNKLVYEKDLVFNKLKAHLGVFFKSNIPQTGIVSPDYAVYYTNGIIEDVKFLEVLFRSPSYIREFICRATGIVEGLIRLYTGDLFDIAVPVPPKQEQRMILAHIENISTKIAKAIGLKEQEIEKLKEYKSSLINSAVTGKVKIV